MLTTFPMPRRRMMSSDILALNAGSSGLELRRAPDIVRELVRGATSVF